MEFQVLHEVTGIYDILSPHGELDLATHAALREQLLDLLRDGRNELVVDLGQTTFIDSTALGSLISARKNALASDGSFSVICDDPQILKVFVITRLAEVFAIFDSRESWTASLTGV